MVWSGTAEPFGETDTQGSSVAFNLRFPGQYENRETGLSYNYFRIYTSSIGRYIQPDPIGQSGGINVYNYSYQNPIRITDPDGKGVWAAVIVCGGLTAYEYFDTTRTLRELGTELVALNKRIGQLEEQCPPSGPETADDFRRLLEIQDLKLEAVRLAAEKIKQNDFLNTGFFTGVVCPAVIIRLPGP